MSVMSAVLRNIDLSYPASMNSPETWDVPDISLNSCWCDQPVDLELPQQCLLNCVSCPLWKKNHNINERFHKVLFKYQVPIWYLYFSLNTAAYLKLLCVEFHNFFTNFGAPGGSMEKDISIIDCIINSGQNHHDVTHWFVDYLKITEVHKVPRP